MTKEKKLKKAFVFPSILEVITYCIVGFLIAAPVAFTLEDLTKEHATGDSILEQIGNMIIFSSETLGVIIGILIVISIWSVFKFNRLERRIVEMQNILVKNENIISIENEILTCPKCGNHYNKGDKFCEQCGNQFN